MKHVKRISKSPSRAQSASTGSILTVISEFFSLLAGFFTSKESGSATE